MKLNEIFDKSVELDWVDEDTVYFHINGDKFKFAAVTGTDHTVDPPIRLAQIGFGIMRDMGDGMEEEDFELTGDHNPIPILSAVSRAFEEWMPRNDLIEKVWWSADSLKRAKLYKRIVSKYIKNNPEWEFKDATTIVREPTDSAKESNRRHAAKKDAVVKEYNALKDRLTAFDKNNPNLPKVAELFKNVDSIARNIGNGFYSHVGDSIKSTHTSIDKLETIIQDGERARAEFEKMFANKN